MLALGRTRVRNRRESANFNAGTKTPPTEPKEESRWSF
jgi:hypothetical protein